MQAYRPDTTSHTVYRLRVTVPFFKASRKSGEAHGAVLVTGLLESEPRAKLLALDLQGWKFPRAEVLEIWLDKAQVSRDHGLIVYDWEVVERLYRTPETGAQRRELEAVIPSTLGAMQ